MREAFWAPTGTMERLSFGCLVPLEGCELGCPLQDKNAPLSHKLTTSASIHPSLKQLIPGARGDFGTFLR